MSEMVEKVAEAIFGAFEKHGEWDELALQGGRFYITGSIPKEAFALAIIAAIRGETSPQPLPPEHE
jgi:hypothetical protein